MRQHGFYQALPVEPRREPAAQCHGGRARRLGFACKPEAGPVDQFGFSDGDPCSRGVREQGQSGHGFNGEIREPLFAKLPFLRACESAARVVSVGRNGDVVAREADIVRREGELGELFIENEVRGAALARQQVAETHTVIKGAEHHRKRPARLSVLPQRDSQLPVMVAHLAPLAERVGPGGVILRPRRLHQCVVAAEHGAIAQPQAEPRFVQDGRAINRHTVGDGARRIDRHDDAPVGRFQFKWRGSRRGPGCAGSTACSRDEEGQECRRPPRAEFTGQTNESGVHGDVSGSTA